MESTRTNETLENLIVELKKQSADSKLLGAVAENLQRPLRIRREVNLSRIDRCTKDGDMIIVPGKVLGGGEIGHKVTISAFKFSESAVAKLKASGSTIIPLNKITKESITAKKVRIIG